MERLGRRTKERHRKDGAMHTSPHRQEKIEGGGEKEERERQKVICSKKEIHLSGRERTKGHEDGSRSERRKRLRERSSEKTESGIRTRRSRKERTSAEKKTDACTTWVRWARAREEGRGGTRGSTTDREKKEESNVPSEKGRRGWMEHLM